MSKKFVIINSSDVESIDFGQVLEHRANGLRYNNAGDKTFVKFEGETPTFLEGKTQYSHSEILSILDGPEWTPQE